MKAKTGQSGLGKPHWYYWNHVKGMWTSQLPNTKSPNWSQVGWLWKDAVMPSDFPFMGHVSLNLRVWEEIVWGHSQKERGWGCQAHSTLSFQLTKWKVNLVEGEKRLSFCPMRVCFCCRWWSLIIVWCQKKAMTVWFKFILENW